MPGRIFVGRYNPKTKTSSSFPGAKTVILHPGSQQPYGKLTPYGFKNHNGEFPENGYQFRKVYHQVYAQTQHSYVVGYSGQQLIWSHPAEEHSWMDGDALHLTEEYWVWREKGLTHDFAVRYPNGFQGRKECVCLVTDEGEILDYLEGRRVYYQVFTDSDIMNHVQFRRLQKLLQTSDVLLVEVDGPDSTHGQFGEDAVEATLENMRLAREDPSIPFGHCWVVAAMLQDFTEDEIFD